MQKRGLYGKSDYCLQCEQFLARLKGPSCRPQNGNIRLAQARYKAYFDKAVKPSTEEIRQGVVSVVEAGGAEEGRTPTPLGGLPILSDDRTAEERWHEKRPTAVASKVPASNPQARDAEEEDCDREEHTIDS